MEPFAAGPMRAAYDAVAEDYAAAFADDLDRLPVDRAVLDAAAGRLAGTGPVLDLGCGPGQVAQRLGAGGAQVVGLDLSTGMLAVARRRAPTLAVSVGDLRHLPVRSGVVAGAVAFYCLHNLARSELGGALEELARVLRTDGLLVVATHLGEGQVVVEELLGHHVAPVGGTFYAVEELVQAVTDAGFAVDEVVQREPLDHEHPSRRAYLTAVREADEPAGSVR